MRYLSVCSGIEAASVAWHPLNWEPVAFAEVEPFPSAVLAHHYPNVPNWGDMTKFKEWPDAAIDVLVGGTPCQSFSVAGKRGGMDDPRGQLAYAFAGIAARYKPEWIVWENVFGVLSSNGGRDFAGFVRGLGELGYQCAWRVLDAQYFGVPQRRRRVFVVGCLGGWQRAAAVLFERESMLGNPAPSRKAREVAPTIPVRSTAGGGLGTDFDCDGGVIQHVDTVGTLCADSHPGAYSGQDAYTGRLIPTVAHSLRGEGFDASEDGTGRGTPLVPVVSESGDIASTLRTGGNDHADVYNSVAVGVFQDSDFGVQQYDSAGTLRAGRIPEHQMVLQPVHAFDARQSDVIQYGDKTGPLDTDGHTVAVAIPIISDADRADSSAQTPSPDAEGRIRLRDPGLGIGDDGDPMFTLQATKPHAVAFDTTQITSPANYSNPKPGDPCHPLAAGAHAPAVAFDLRGREGGSQFEGPHDTANIRAASGGSSRSYVAAMQVRRLTPVECERLQGFPDGYTAIPWRNKPASECPDGPRYKALGNSMAVPVMRWIGRRIDAVIAIKRGAA